MANEWGLEKYKGLLILGSAVPSFATGHQWHAEGTIFRPGRLGSVVAIKRIDGPTFHTKEAAEQHGLELCRKWIDGSRTAS